MVRAGMRGRRRIRLPRQLVVVVLLAACAATAARAQTSTLTLSPAAISFPTPTVADYNAGYLCTSIGFTATADAGNRTDSLFIRLTSATAMPSTIGGVTKPLAEFQYNTSALGCAATTGWTAVPGQTSAPALVWSARYANKSLTGTVYFRLTLAWATDRGGATYTLPDIRWFLNRSTTVPAAP